MFHRTNDLVHLVRSSVRTFCTTRGRKLERGSGFQTGLLDPVYRRSRNADILSRVNTRTRGRNIQDVERTCDN